MPLTKNEYRALMLEIDMLTRQINQQIRILTRCKDRFEHRHINLMKKEQASLKKCMQQPVHLINQKKKTGVLETFVMASGLSKLIEFSVAVFD